MDSVIILYRWTMKLKQQVTKKKKYFALTLKYNLKTIILSIKHLVIVSVNVLLS